MSDEVRQAAERLIREAESTVPAVHWINVCVPKPDILLVARAALASDHRDAALILAHNALNNCPFVDRLERQQSHEDALGAIRAILGSPPYDAAIAGQPATTEDDEAPDFAEPLGAPASHAELAASFRRRSQPDARDQEIAKLREAIHVYHEREALQQSNAAPDLDECPRCASPS